MKAKYVILGLFLLLTLLVSSVFVSADCEEMQEICEGATGYTFFASAIGRFTGSPTTIAWCSDADGMTVWFGECFMDL